MRRLSRWWNRLVPTRKALVVVAVIVISVPFVIVIVRYERLKDQCGPGISRHGPDHECVGVTDGSYTFAPGFDLGPVLKLIKKEDSKVDHLAEQGKQAVTIAYAVPLDTPTSALSVELRHELEGAYLEQDRNNNFPTSGTNAGPQVLVRLLVANTGTLNEQWPVVVAQLRREPVMPAPLVAVVGFGESLATTTAAITALLSQPHPISVVAARLTADNLISDQANVEGLVRIAPTNTDEAMAAVEFLKQIRPTPRRALIIQDLALGDSYVQTLGSAFAKAWLFDPTHSLIPPQGGSGSAGETYDSSLPLTESTFKQMLPDICQDKPDVIYFAGRGADLATFLQVLPGRNCDSPLTIVTGSDVVDLQAQLQAQIAAHQQGIEEGLSTTTLFYAALASQNEWEKNSADFNTAAIEPFQSGGCSDGCYTTLFPQESLDDGAAIMAYDAVTAIVWNLGKQQPPGKPLNLRNARSATIGEWNELHNCNAIPGASGYISIINQGNEKGNAFDKAIPIMQLESDGSVVFQMLSSSQGTPFVAPTDTC